MAELIEKYQENENFAPKQNERDCPLTHKNIDSCTGMKVSKRKIRPWRIVEIQFFRVFFVTLLI